MECWRVYAIINPQHLRRGRGSRVSFSSSGQIGRYFQAISARGDERGHIVASTFSGPPAWHNLSPQNARANRNMDYQSITTDWFGTECDEYRLRVKFLPNGKTVNRIDTRIHNSFLSGNSRF